MDLYHQCSLPLSLNFDNDTIYAHNHMLSMMERISRMVVSYFWWFAVFLKFHQFKKLPGRFRGRTKCLQISTTAQPWHGGWWWSAVTLHKRWLRGKHRRVAGRQAHFASHTRAMIPLSISHVMHLLTMHQLPLHANPHPALGARNHLGRIIMNLQHFPCLRAPLT